MTPDEEIDALPLSTQLLHQAHLAHERALERHLQRLCDQLRDTSLDHLLMTIALVLALLNATLGEPWLSIALIVYALGVIGCGLARHHSRERAARAQEKRDAEARMTAAVVRGSPLPPRRP